MPFDDDLEFGKEGETKVRQILESSGIFEQILDCSNDKYFQEKDIDFLALAGDGHIAKYEVKTDRVAHRTGNIAFEVTTNGNRGCLAKTEADFIIYVLALQQMAIEAVLRRQKQTLSFMSWQEMVGYFVSMQNKCDSISDGSNSDQYEWGIMPQDICSKSGN